MKPELEPYFRAPDNPSSGSYIALPEGEYRRQHAVNASILKNPTPLQMKAAMEGRFDPLSYALQFGSLVHKAILEPEMFDKDDRDSWLAIVQTKTINTKAARAIYESNPKLTIATERMIEKAARAKEAFYKHKQFAWCMQQPGQREISGLAWHPEREVWLKSRVDFKPNCNEWQLDIKTTCAPVHSTYILESEARKFGYDIQARHYTDVHRLITGVEPMQFILAWISGPFAMSTEPDAAPYIPRLMALTREPEDTLSLATAQPIYDDRLTKWTNAAHTDTWEAWENETVPIGRPF